jgi:hypothetical protein
MYVSEVEGEQHGTRRRCPPRKIILVVVLLFLSGTGIVELGIASALLGSEETLHPVDYIIEPVLQYADSYCDRISIQKRDIGSNASLTLCHVANYTHVIPNNITNVTLSAWKEVEEHFDKNEKDMYMN